jgi:hypothetical protein
VIDPFNIAVAVTASLAIFAVVTAPLKIAPEVTALFAKAVANTSLGRSPADIWLGRMAIVVWLAFVILPSCWTVTWALCVGPP